MKGKTLLCLALVASMLLSVFMVGSVGAQFTTIGVEPDRIVDPSLVAGSWFTVEIWVRDVADLGAVEFKLEYNTTVLSVDQPQNVSYGGIFGSTYFPLINIVNETDGRLHYGIMEYFGDPGCTGDGKVGTINFTVDSSGESALDLYDVKLGDTGTPPTPIDCMVIDGFFSNILVWFDAEGGLIDLSSPVDTYWHGLAPGYCNRHQLTVWIDRQGLGQPGHGNLSICDYVNMTPISPSGPFQWFHIENVTVTINATLFEPRTTTGSPTSTAVVVAGWLTPTEAYSSDDVYAYTKAEDAEQTYGTYGFSIPSSATIDSVEVGFEAYFAGNEYMEITCSWDGGTNWATAQSSGTLPGSDDDTTRWLDFTSATSWTPTKLNNANFLSKIKYIFVSGGKSYIYLDWLPVRVNYTEYFPLNYFEFEGQIQDFNWANPLYTQWHEIRPVFSLNYNLTGFTDSDSSLDLTVNDDIQLKNKKTGVAKWYNVDEISTDIVGKKVSGPPSIPEFPLGIVLPIALIVAVVYVWWIDKRKRIIKQQ